MPSALLAGELGVREPGADALATAFARELPRWDLALAATDPPQPAWTARRRMLDIRRPQALVRAVRACDVLVLGDDALRGRGPAQTARAVFAMAGLAKALGRRVVVLGVGADLLDRRRDRVRVRMLVRWADLLVLRDVAAAEVLADAGAPGPFRVGADPAWCAVELRSASSHACDEVLVILDARGAEADRHAVTRLVRALDLVAAAGLRIRIAPWKLNRYGADDLDLAQAVASRLAARARVLLPPAGFQHACRDADRARVVLTMRARGLLVAASAQTPAVAFGGEPELARLAGRLRQTCLPAGVDHRGLASATLAAAAAPPPAAAVVEAERGAARESFRLLRLLLEGARSDEDHDMVALPLAPDPLAAYPGLDEGSRRPSVVFRARA